jgi:spoIIIJ-associated protein
MTGSTVDSALESALKELGCNREDVEVEVLSHGKRGFLGLGASDAKVLVTVKGQEKSFYDEIKEESSDLFVKDYLLSILDKMGIEASVSATENDGSLNLDVSGSLMGVVIGRRGDTLDALQYLCSLVYNKGREDYVRVNVDTENYRAKREETLINLAKRIANTVSKTGKSITLEPMNPNERRIIHSTLQSYDEINTYSIGEDPNRKIVVASKNASRRPRGNYRRTGGYSSSYKRSESAYAEKVASTEE